ncbi:MAG: hypothetical protein M3Y08_02625 [Fibrobacterota bacterium]|nr:hypothetical protein [Fibrobacterota bacterium]
MLRKSGLICVAAVLLWGCDLFSTREFRSKPSQIRTLKNLSAKGDSVTFLATESVWKSNVTPEMASSSPGKVLSKRRLVFTFLGDSLDGADTLKILSLRISEDSTGLEVEKGTRLVRFTLEGVVLEGASTGGGARYFPLKASSQAEAGDSIGDNDSFTALPALLVEGWSDSRSLGILEIRRRQVSLDTLNYQGHLEEAWGISESILSVDSLGAERELARGTFWYGSSGLLKAEQTWPEFDWRSDDGSGIFNPDVNGSVPKAELRRTLVRL